MDILEKIKNYIDKILEFICILMLSVMTILVTYQVITRYIFKNPSAFSEAASQYLFVWLVMLGSSLVFGSMDHLEISIIKDKLKPKSRLVVDILINLSLLIFSFIVCIYGGFLGVLRQMSTMDAALGIPTGVIYLSIPLCGIAMVFYAIYNCARSFKEYCSKNS